MATSLPEGFHYVPDVLTEEGEHGLIDWFGSLPFEAVTMRGYATTSRILRMVVANARRPASGS